MHGALLGIMLVALELLGSAGVGAGEGGGRCEYFRFSLNNSAGIPVNVATGSSM